jgi:hypothetical protein
VSADEDVDVSAGGFSSSVGPHNLNLVHLVRKYLRVEYFFDLLEDAGNFISGDSFRELLEIF